MRILGFALPGLLWMEIRKPVAVVGDGLVCLLDASVDQEFLPVLGDRVFIRGWPNGHNLCEEQRLIRRILLTCRAVRA